MTITGLLFLIVSWGTIIALVSFCLYRVLVKESEKEL
jgi:TM2 domain-containing membrane protein YozV